MQTTLIQKGEQNQRLQETVNTIKNQLLNDKIFDQKFSAIQITTLASYETTFKYVRDRSEDGEFFLEIATGDSSTSKVRKRICVIDIESIDP